MVDNPFQKVMATRKTNEEELEELLNDISVMEEESNFLELSDMFHSIWNYQSNLDYGIMDTQEDKLKVIRECTLAMFMEVAELTDSFPWKPWRKTEDQPFDKDNATRELVDILFFMGWIMKAADITVDELLQKFKWVLKNNLERLENGYSMKKDPVENKGYCDKCFGYTAKEYGDNCPVCHTITTPF